jgi:hypothetical protein
MRGYDRVAERLSAGPSADRVGEVRAEPDEYLQRLGFKRF